MRGMSKITNVKKMSNWTQQEEDGDERILENKTLKNNGSLIVLGVKTAEEFFSLRSNGCGNIVLTDSTSTLDMKAIAGTQKIFAVVRQSKKKEDRGLRLDAAVCSFSCPKCRENSGIDACLYKNDRSVKTAHVKQKAQVARAKHAQ